MENLNCPFKATVCWVLEVPDCAHHYCRVRLVDHSGPFLLQAERGQSIFVYQRLMQTHFENAFDRLHYTFPLTAHVAGGRLVEVPLDVPL